jgi:hypothetical protein
MTKSKSAQNLGKNTLYLTLCCCIWFRKFLSQTGWLKDIGGKILRTVDTNRLCVFYNKITFSATRFDRSDQHQVNSDTESCHSKPVILRNSEIRHYEYISLIKCCCAVLLIACKSCVFVFT